MFRAEIGTIALLTSYFRVINEIHCPSYFQYKQVALKLALIGRYQGSRSSGTFSDVKDSSCIISSILLSSRMLCSGVEQKSKAQKYTST
jgi:hypothetical protein